MAFEHPHPSNLGIGVDLNFILPHDGLVARQVFEQFPKFSQLDLTLLDVGLEHRPGTSVNQLVAMESAADGFPADVEAFTLPQEQSQKRTGPATAKEAEVAGGLGGHPGDEEGDPSEAQAKGSTPLPPGQSLNPAVLESLEPAIHGA